MNSEKYRRKLTAVLSADVFGYSRLMRDNEASTVDTITAYREIISELIEHHRGRVVDFHGDNVLSEFSSVVDAVRCAVQIQEDLKGKNEELPDKRKMEFRIGINLGDVIQEGNRIYGDGVNVAARIESLADAGGICISRSAYDQVEGKLNFRYEYLGEHQVKNIDEPVRVYKVLMESKAETQKPPVVSDVEKGPKTIAVLPFVNISSDPEQEYFVDGLSEEILNSLCQIPDLGVTARTSSFSFKGTSKTVQEIAGVLGVENILEGSVRKAGEKLRITAQLVRATDGLHLWSKTYNRELKDIFEVQEEIATAVADELKITLGVGKSLKQLGGTNNLDAYARYLAALGQGLGQVEDCRFSLKSIDIIIEMDPKFALAWNLKAQRHIWLIIFGPADRAVIEQEAALYAAQKAIEFEPTLGNAYNSLGFIKTMKGDWVAAEWAYRKALDLKTDLFQGIDVFSSGHYTAVGNFTRALELLEVARRNDPLNQLAHIWYFFSLGLLGDMPRAEEEYERCTVLFGKQFSTNIISRLRIGTGNVKQRHEIVSSNPIHAVVKDHLDSRERGLMELRRIYTEDKNLSTDDFYEIALGAAYFGDPEFSMNAIQKGVDIDASGIFELWFPVYRQVRQLPRFKEFVKEIGLVDYWNEFGWPDFCHKLDNGDFEFD